MYRPVDIEILERLGAVVGEQGVLTAEEERARYDHDETEDLHYLPEVVVLPDTPEQIAEVLKLATAERIPVTPRAAGTSLSGGTLPVFGGISLSLERLNRILEIDLKNHFAVAEAGVVTGDLQRAVEAHGLFYPPDPASLESCTIGGNVVVSAGGPRAVKYGITKDYVYGLEAVLPTGQIIQTGGKLVKNVTGYNLTQLLVGSEGTLAVVTKAILKLLPLPRFRRTVLVPFGSLDGAAETIPATLHAKIIPVALEFMERAAIEASLHHLGKTLPFGECEALLLIAVDGNREDVLDQEVEQIGELCLDHGARDVLLAESGERERELWRIRRAVGEAVKKRSPYRELDAVVPRSEIPRLVRLAREVTGRYGLQAIMYGHGGDGNLHINVLKGEMAPAEWGRVIPRVTNELFRQVVALGGMISGEHGIGYVQKAALPLALDETVIQLMRAIKACFDPAHILNPGKIFP